MIVVYFLIKNEKMKGFFSFVVVFVLLGIMELVFFGVNLKFKFLFFCVLIGFVIVVILVGFFYVIVVLMGLVGFIGFLFIGVKLILFYLLCEFVFFVVVFIIIFFYGKMYNYLVNLVVEVVDVDVVDVMI